MNDDLTEALITSNDCTCELWIDSDGDEYIPRLVRERSLDCPDHGETAAKVLPAHDDVISDAWTNAQCAVDHAREVNLLRDAAETIRHLHPAIDHATFLDTWADRLDHKL